MNACILAIGNELTTGQSLDTNSAYLSRELGEWGIATRLHETVGDEQSQIAEAIARLAGQCDLLVITGGLGPTQDDVTRFALAEAMGVELALDAASLVEMEAFFQKRHYPMAEINRVQAMLPVGCAALANAEGTAPGMRATLGDCDIFVFPGVPYEMRAMFKQFLLPELTEQTHVIRHRIIHCFGCGESTLAERMDELMLRDGPVVVGTTVANGVVSVRIISRAETAGAADAQAEGMVRQIVERLGDWVFGFGTQTLPEVLGEKLAEAGQALVTAESCTGGLLGKLLTDIPGSTRYYRGGAVVYSNDLKRDILDVPRDMLDEHGAVSEPVAETLAVNAREKFNSDWAIATTGVAGPGGGTEEKPVGLVFTALAGPDGCEVTRHQLGGSRDRIRLRTALFCLNQLRLKLG